MHKVIKLKTLTKVSDFMYTDLKGRHGQDGIPGEHGLQGIEGPHGKTGQQGDKGVKGDQGEQGVEGTRGHNGENGLHGDRGEQGPMPKHETRGDAIRFEIAPNTWGKWIALSGQQSNQQNMSVGSIKESEVIALIEALGEGVDYNILIDTVDTYKYIGKSVPGTATSTALWKIKRIDLTDTTGDIPILWASGTAELTQIWDDRLTYTYTATGL